MACPKNDCRGYLTKNYICNLCNVKVCSKCHKIKWEKDVPTVERNHECSKDDIESVNILKKTTRPCPKCNSPI